MDKEQLECIMKYLELIRKGITECDSTYALRASAYNLGVLTQYVQILIEDLENESNG